MRACQTSRAETRGSPPRQSLTGSKNMRSIIFTALFVFVTPLVMGQGIILTTKTEIDTTNAALGRIEGLLPAGIGTASDTVNGPYNATPYVVGDIKQDSTAKWLIFNIGADAGIITNASATADTANATANVRRLILVPDTTGWGAFTADNAQFDLTAAKAGKVIGEIVFAMKTEGTVSTAVYRSVEVRQWFRTVIGQKLFGLVVMDGAYTGKKREQSTFTLTFIKQN